VFGVGYLLSKGVAGQYLFVRELGRGGKPGATVTSGRSPLVRSAGVMPLPQRRTCQVPVRCSVVPCDETVQVIVPVALSGAAPYAVPV